MSDLRTAAQQMLEALEGGADSWQLVGPAIDALKEALVEDAMQKFTDVNQELEAALTAPIMKPEIKDDKPLPPPEAQTEAEKIAYCAGWWDGLRAERDGLLEVVRDAITTLDRAGYPTAAAELRDAVAKHS